MAREGGRERGEGVGRVSAGGGGVGERGGHVEHRDEGRGPARGDHQRQRRRALAGLDDEMDEMFVDGGAVMV